MQIPRIDGKNALGLVSKIVGLGKEIAGSVTGNSRLREAGQVQQDKGTERLKAIRAEAEAKKHQVKGAAKEKFGDLTDNENLRAEGEAQENKGEAETEETKQRAEAKAHEKKADALDKKQEAIEES